MKGTIDEVLDWVTHHHEYAPLLNMSRQRLVGLRWKLHEGYLSETRKEEILERLKNRIEYLKSTDVHSPYCSLKSIRKVRDRYVLPAIVRDHSGTMYSETGFIRKVKREEKMKDLHLDWVCGAMTRGDMPSKEVVREALNRKGWNIFEPRMELPSIWEVE